MMSFIFLLSISLLILFSDNANSFNDDITLRQAYKVTRALGGAADEVYYGGENSRITLRANFPSNILFTNVSGREIVIVVNTRSGQNDVHVPTAGPVNGSLPTVAGVYTLTVCSRRDYVQVNYK